LIDLCEGPECTGYYYQKVVFVNKLNRFSALQMQVILSISQMPKEKQGERNYYILNF